MFTVQKHRYRLIKLFCTLLKHQSLLSRYDKDTPFSELIIPVNCGSLHESLKQFVEGEKLEGDNAYMCEKCNEKVTTTRSLPPPLFQQQLLYVKYT